MSDNNIVLPLAGNNTGTQPVSDDTSVVDNGGKPFVEKVDFTPNDGVNNNSKTPEEIEAEKQAAKAAEEGASNLTEEEQAAADKAAAEAKAAEEAEEAKAAEGASEEVTEVEIEGVTYSINEEGNAVNENNEVVYTVEQLAEMEEEEEISSEFKLAELSSIQPVDDKGEPIQYEATDEGRRQYIEDVYTAGGIDRANKILEERYAANPLLKTVTDYIIANGSLDGFSEQPYTRNPITKDSTEEDMIATIRQARKMKGDTEIEIAQAISWAKSDNKLSDLASTSDAYLTQYEQHQKKQLAEQAAQVEQARIAKNQQYVNTLINTISKGELDINGQKVNIPAILEVNTPEGKRVAQRDELIRYATEVNQYRMPNGSIQNATQYQIDKWVKNTQRTLNDDIFEMVTLFTGGDNSQLLKTAINSNKAATIKKRLKLKRNTSQRGTSNNKGKIKLKYNK